MKALAALVCGLVFGAGLAVSGMTDTAKVQGFLDLWGNWIPDLAFVMGAAVCVTLITFRFILKRSTPLLTADFHLPSSIGLDGRLLAGAAIFGIGWGIYGFCPGPAISALVYLETNTALFVIAMLTGMMAASRFSREQ